MFTAPPTVGKTWTNVLKPADVDGARDLQYAYDVPGVMLAATQGTGGPVVVAAAARSRGEKQAAPGVQVHR